MITETFWARHKKYAITPVNNISYYLNLDIITFWNIPLVNVQSNPITSSWILSIVIMTTTFITCDNLKNDSQVSISLLTNLKAHIELMLLRDCQDTGIIFAAMVYIFKFSLNMFFKFFWQTITDSSHVADLMNCMATAIMEELTHFFWPFDDNCLFWQLIIGNQLLTSLKICILFKNLCLA